MSEGQHDEYLAVLTALYDYEATSNDEISIKEDQALFLLERTDEEWWKVQYRTDTSVDEDVPSGLVPASYVEEAEPKSIVKALFDYEAASKGELTITEDEKLNVFDYEEQWILVKSEREGGRVGYVPANYVEEFNDETIISQTDISHIVVPDSPHLPPSAPYMDPADRVAATASKSKADAIETWSVSEVDPKGKKKKGTLGVGNGAIFFASESDKTPVQKWQTSSVENVKIEKSKHVHFTIGGPQSMSLHFHTGSKDVADAIVQKLNASKGPVNGLSVPHSDSPRSPSPSKKNGVSVRFDPSPAVIPPPDTPIDEHDEYDTSEGVLAVALYDFTADGEDELTVNEGERLIILDRISSDEWWKCRNVHGSEGVVPASYIEITGDATASVSRETNFQEADEKAESEERERQRLENESLERERQEQERQELEQQERTRQEQEQRERERQERERKEKERKEKERKEKERKEKERKEKERKERDEKEQKAREARDRALKESQASRPSSMEKTSSSASKTTVVKPSSGGSQPKFPNEGKTRIWYDHSGQWKTEAEFLGVNKGKIRLHKINGVVIEVPPEKMSVADVRYIESITDHRLLPTSVGASGLGSHPKDDDDVPLGARKSHLEATTTSGRPALPPKRAFTFDWFEFFLNAGCEVDDCTRYASAFERDKIDETILPDIKESTLRSLGLREGDIIRVMKAIDQRKGSSAQIATDEQIAKALQAEEDSRQSSATSPPNLFAGPGGVLRTQRRTRPPRGSTAPPVNVNANALSAASEQASRSTSPLTSSPIAARPGSPAITVSKPATQSSGFGDDAWTNRPSSTRPTSVPPATAQPIANISPSSTSALPAPAVSPSVSTLPASALPAPPPPPVSAPPTTVAPNQPSMSPASNLVASQDNTQFELLAKISQMRPPSAPAQPVNSTLQPMVTGAPQSFHSGLGMGSSPISLGQHIQNQQTGIYAAASGPKGPLAPVPSNQGLLNPLVPVTSFNQFIPTRPLTNAPLQQPSFQPIGQPLFSSSTQPSFLSSPPPAFGSQSQLLPQQTGFPGLNAAGGLAPRPVEYNNTFSGVPNPGFMPPNGIGGLQPQPTGFNPSFSQLRSSSPQRDHSPATIFAKMKAGTFTDETGSQPADKYEALRPQQTGWQGPFPSQGYGGF